MEEVQCAGVLNRNVLIVVEICNPILSIHRAAAVDMDTHSTIANGCNLVGFDESTKEDINPVSGSAVDDALVYTNKPAELRTHTVAWSIKAQE
ncbi:hypothetical protein D9M71_411070 [compost metagenome]